MPTNSRQNNSNPSPKQPPVQLTLFDEPSTEPSTQGPNKPESSLTIEPHLFRFSNLPEPRGQFTANGYEPKDD